MSNDVPVIQNTKLLLLSLGLAAVVVILYNVHINQIRNAGKDDVVRLLQYKLDRRAGDQISDKDDIEVVVVNRQIAAGLGSVHTERSRVAGKVLSRPVTRGNWVMIDDFNEASKNSPSSRLDRGQVVVTLPLDQRMVPGRLLRFTDRVNLLGQFINDKGQYETYNILDGLVVYGIGGRVLNESLSLKQSEDEGVSSYRDIQVVIQRDLSRPLHNLLSHARDQQFRIEIRSPLEGPGPFDREINPALVKYTQSAAASTRREPASPSPMSGMDDPPALGD